MASGRLIKVLTKGLVFFKGRQIPKGTAVKLDEKDPMVKQMILDGTVVPLENTALVFGKDHVTVCGDRNVVDLHESPGAVLLWIKEYIREKAPEAEIVGTAAYGQHVRLEVDKINEPFWSKLLFPEIRKYVESVGAEMQVYCSSWKDSMPGEKFKLEITWPKR
jgi:hypothetical protein